MPFSTFLNGRDPDRLRGLEWLALSDLGTVLSRTFSDDGGGGGTQTWGTTAGSVPCMTEPLASTSGLLAGRIDERSTHLVTFPAGTVVETDDRLVIAGRGTFEVTAVRRQTAEWVREFEVVEVS